MNYLKKIEDRAFKTYKSRLAAAERLKLLGQMWNLSLIALSTSTTIAAIGLLTDPAMYGEGGPTYLTALAVLSLVASLIVASQEYAARSRNMFMSYRKFQRIATEAELLRATSWFVRRRVLTGLVHDYNAAVDESENHTTADFDKGYRGRRLTSPLFVSNLFVGLPVASFVAPIVVLSPFVVWMVNAGAQ